MSTTARAKSEMIDVGHCKVIKVSDIIVSKFNVRDQDIEPITSEKFQELCDSIKSDGLVEPLIVRPIGSGKYETIAGTRRLRALQCVGAKETAVVIRQMSDNDVRIASLVENIHRDNLTENELQKTLEDIYLATWDQWKPKNWHEIMPREKDRRSGKIITYDCTTDKGKLILAKQYLSKIHSETTRKFSKTKQSIGTKPEIIFPTQIMRELRERIGYKASTQTTILAGYGSGKTFQDYIEELSPITRARFEEDKRIKALEEEQKKELARKQGEAIKRAQKNKKKTKVQIADDVANKYFKALEKEKEKPKIKQEPKPLEQNPQLETNPVRAREQIVFECMRLFKVLTGEDLNMDTISAGEMQAKSKHANDTMKEIANYYIREGELANVQCAIIPTQQALGRFIDLVYDSLESQHRKDDMLRP